MKKKSILVMKEYVVNHAFFIKIMYFFYSLYFYLIFNFLYKDFIIFKKRVL